MDSLGELSKFIYWAPTVQIHFCRWYKAVCLGALVLVGKTPTNQTEGNSNPSPGSPQLKTDRLRVASGLSFRMLIPGSPPLSVLPSFNDYVMIASKYLKSTVMGSAICQAPSRYGWFRFLKSALLLNTLIPWCPVTRKGPPLSLARPAGSALSLTCQPLGSCPSSL